MGNNGLKTNRMEKIIGLQIILYMSANVDGNPCLKSSSECQEIRMPLVSNELKAPLVAELDITSMNKQLKSYISDDIQLKFSKDIKDMVKSEQNNLKTTMLKDYTSKMKKTKEGYDMKISDMIQNLQAKEVKVQEEMSEVYKDLNASEANFNEKMTDLLSGFEQKQESLKLAMLSEYLSKLQVSHDTNKKQIIDLANDLKSQFANVSRNVKDELKEVNTYLQTQTKELEEWKTNLMEIMKDTLAPQKYKDCSYVRGNQLKSRSGVYIIYPDSVEGTLTYCDMTTDVGGWTVIHRRIDGTTNFDRNWNEYKEGFGDVEKEYWLGNKYLNILTSSGKYELRVDLVDTNNKKTYAVYKTFVVGDENSKFKLTIGDYTGTADICL
ncbi:Fibrinogen-like protein 1,Fibrinogen-like protein A,Fibroleukin,Ryncolin-4 [Mytilus coruscus]|uniref:Fibrinogen-like protein 1,Fibrinogen-like protein A,Fibroleukin,Ryncolin-4 n=1 Tax=Mytilus coruscus TaxID=42192 RepID=A0A6J8B5H0_MYTCO|nr:Fibrinogen-like protein 1,Fibrinogen-like protein A,Fibroleukin,Ryncolin-4 [Mytilus coruscus]